MMKFYYEFKKLHDVIFPFEHHHHRVLMQHLKFHSHHHHHQLLLWQNFIFSFSCHHNTQVSSNWTCTYNLHFLQVFFVTFRKRIQLRRRKQKKQVLWYFHTTFLFYLHIHFTTYYNVACKSISSLHKIEYIHFNLIMSVHASLSVFFHNFVENE